MSEQWQKTIQHIVDRCRRRCVWWRWRRGDYLMFEHGPEKNLVSVLMVS